MNLVLYIASYFGLMIFLALTAWGSVKTLRLSGLSRVLLGLSATPLVLPTISLVLAAAWPAPPRLVLLAGPMIFVGLFVLVRWQAMARLVVIATRHLRRLKFSRNGMGAAILMLYLGFIASLAIYQNSRQPVSQHDALIYFNEARLFAQTPRWETHLAMTNPTAPTALVRGHTHTWLYTSFLSTALLATDHEPGAGHDTAAHFFAQFNILLLLGVLAGLSWQLSRRNVWLTVTATAGVALIPHVAYIPVATSIDAFRIIPLILLATVFASGPRTRGAWILSGLLCGLAAAAHTLNPLFVAVLLAARLLTGLHRRQWLRLLGTFVPAALVALLPVTLYYLHLKSETGRFGGNGMHYFFYTGSLQASRLGTLLTETAFNTQDFLASMLTTHGKATILVPFTFALLGLAGVRRVSAVLFLSAAFLLLCGLIASGLCFPALHKLTIMMMENQRYSLAVWVIGPTLVVGCLVELTLPLKKYFSRLSPLTTLLGALLASTSVLAASRQIQANWALPIDAEQFLQEGEKHLARLTEETLTEGENWITDRNTVAYYCDRTPIFLYTPAGRVWIEAPSPEAAWEMIRRTKVRIVALNNLSPDWWPTTPFYQTLIDPAHAHRIRLPRWDVFIVHRQSSTVTKNIK